MIHRTNCICTILLFAGAKTDATKLRGGAWNNNKLGREKSIQHRVLGAIPTFLGNVHRSTQEVSPFTMSFNFDIEGSSLTCDAKLEDGTVEFTCKACEGPNKCIDAVCNVSGASLDDLDANIEDTAQSYFEDASAQANVKCTMSTSGSDFTTQMSVSIDCDMNMEDYMYMTLGLGDPKDICSCSAIVDGEACSYCSFNEDCVNNSLEDELSLIPENPLEILGLELQCPNMDNIPSCDTE